MKILKEIGLIILGGFLVFAFFAYQSINLRILNSENNTKQLVEYINKNVALKTESTTAQEKKK